MIIFRKISTKYDKSSDFLVSICYNIRISKKWGVYMNNINKILKIYQNELVNINDELKKMPTGRLVRRNNAFYHWQPDTEIGITRNKALVRRLCRKKYLQLRKKQIEANLKVSINKLNTKTAHELIDKLSSPYKFVPRNYFYNPAIDTWLNKSYEKNPLPIKGMTYYSMNKVEFRSKSEVLIANELEKYELPYLYEVALLLGSQRMYPDFIIKNPYNNRTIIWEHFGAVHKEEYEMKMNDKMAAFRKAGYILGENLIYTFEADIADASRISELIEEVILR